MHITGTHAIEEDLDNAPKGSVLFVMQNEKNSDEYRS